MIGKIGHIEDNIVIYFINTPNKEVYNNILKETETDEKRKQ